MDIFRFTPSTVPTALDRGQSINGIDKVLWVERYRQAGEFTIVGDISSNLREQLPLGSLISHTDTLEVMMVENHEIVEKKDTPPELIVSGRSFETFLENRIIGNNFDPGLPSQNFLRTYILPAAFSWVQAVKLINDHIKVSDVYHAKDGVPNVRARTFISGLTQPTTDDREMARGEVYEALLELLAISDVGIRTIRPSEMSSGWGDPPLTTTFLVHRGTDKTESVVFSWSSGDLEGAEYLWSLKRLKTSALLSSRYVDRRIASPGSALENRMMHIFAEDLDQHLNEYPTGGARTAIFNQLGTRGNQALANRNEVSVVKANIAKNSKFKYRRDYDIGDLITIDGNYDTSATMRISEYVEIDDENGYSGYPTLSTIT